MIIGFWSEKPGRGSSTYNMIAAGLGISERYNKRVILMQGKHDYNRIEYAFTPYDDESVMKEDYGYYNYGGMDSIISKLENNILTEKEFNKEIIAIRNTNLCYILSGKGRNNTEFQSRFLKCYDKYIEFLKNSNDICMIELDNNLQYVNSEKFNKFDVFIVNLPQDIKSLHKIVKNKDVMNKALFIVGNYDVNSEYNLNNIRRKYGIDEKRICAIPYSVKFRDAVCSGRSQEFYERHMEKKKGDSEYEFIRAIECMAKLIMERCLSGE